MKNILFIGPPGAGKGSVTNLIENKYKIIKLTSGDTLRKVIRDKSPIGKTFIDYIKKGQLAPDIIVNKMMQLEFLEKIATKSSENVIMWDGYPRNINQAKSLNEFLEPKNYSFDLVVWMEIDIEIVIERVCNRLLCESCYTIYNLISNQPKINNKCDKCSGNLVKRDDDKEEIVRQRFNKYITETKPLLDFYKNKTQVKIIDASKSLNSIFIEIERVIFDEQS